MAKRTPRVNPVLKDGSDTLTVPGVNLSELLELESLFPDITDDITILVFVTVCIAQIRVATAGSVKPSDLLRSDSVNYYIRTLLSKSPPLLRVGAAIAIRRTLATYVNDVSDDRIKSDFADLITNTSGPSNTRGGVAVALSSEERLRTYRRGLMLQFTGAIQTAPIYSPNKIYRSLELLDLQTFFLKLPFKPHSFTPEGLISTINEYLGVSEDDQLAFVDTFVLPDGKVPLEKELFITRETPSISAVKNLPSNLDSLPKWKQLGIQQSRDLSNRLKGGS